jgi:hypothetical protein
MEALAPPADVIARYERIVHAGAASA